MIAATTSFALFAVRFAQSLGKYWGGVFRLVLFDRMKYPLSLLLLLQLFFLCGCNGVTHVSATEFERRFAWVDQQQSMETVTYLGQENGRAFIRLRSMSTIGEKWSDRVIYVELAELDSRFRDSLPQKSQALYK
jgi:hypothetical protein